MKVKSKIKLSTGVLQMKVSEHWNKGNKLTKLIFVYSLNFFVFQKKFMKRTVIEEQEEIALEEQKKQIDDEHWYLSIEESKMSESSNVRNVLVEASYSIFDEIGFGRMSFNGFNPQIEVRKLYIFRIIID